MTSNAPNVQTVQNPSHNQQSVRCNCTANGGLSFNIDDIRTVLGGRIHSKFVSFHNDFFAQLLNFSDTGKSDNIYFQDNYLMWQIPTEYKSTVSILVEYFNNKYEIREEHRMTVKHGKNPNGASVTTVATHCAFLFPEILH
jgi:hypothetical protein